MMRNCMVLVFALISMLVALNSSDTSMADMMVFDIAVF